MATNQGDQYNNKYIMPLAEGWDLDSINSFIEVNGLTVNPSSPAVNQAAVDRFTPSGRFFVTYTHIQRDVPTQVRTAFIIPNEISWYTERGWEMVSKDSLKVEIPY